MKIPLAIMTLLVAACVDQGDPTDEPTGSSAEELNCNHNPGVAPPQSRPHGRAYAAWAAAWQAWGYGATSATTPINDSTGAKCGYRQSGPVWFLAGSFGTTETRDCTIPAGRALFFPLISTAYVAWDNDPPPNTYAQLAPIIGSQIDGATVALEIDGRPLVDTAAFRLVSDPLVPAVIPPLDNLYGTTAADCHPRADGNLVCPLGLSAGYYVYVEPLARGRHTIHITATTPFDPTFNLDVTYHLHIH